MIEVVLVVGGEAIERETIISNTLVASLAEDSNFKCAILFEGLADGKPIINYSDSTIIARIASGCICCDNNMIMRVYLNRLIRQKPQQLFLSLSNDTHLLKIKLFLTAPCYEKILKLTKEINLNTISS